MDNLISLSDRIKGCLIGGAVGDALGFPVEFLDVENIVQKHGEKGITEHLVRNGNALISDDTQMTMFTAEGLLRVKHLRAESVLNDCVSEIYRSYLDWLKTQTEEYCSDTSDNTSSLLNEERLYARRGPGTTCLGALSSEKQGSIKNRINNSKGCGGVMRIAPIPLRFALEPSVSLETVDMIAAEAAAITHGHDLGYIPAAFVSHIIYLILKGTDLSEAILDALGAVKVAFKESPYVKGFSRLIMEAVMQAECGLEDSDLDVINILGQGWVAEETVAIAVYCSLKYKDDFEKAIVTSVNHSGDSDSTGAVTGNIMGALIGYSNIPKKYVENLEFKDCLLDLARGLESR